MMSRITNRGYRVSVTLCMLMLCVAVFAQQTVQLQIFHTNDVHSRVEPFPANHPNKQEVDKAGMVRRVAFMDEERKKDPELIFLDCGDFSQGSPYYNLFKGSVEVAFMNLCHYDASTIGNHEFDFGLNNMARIFKEAEFPILNTNYDVSNSVLNGLVKPYTILYRKGLKVGVFGIGAKMEGLVQYKNYAGVEYHDPIDEANKMAEKLKVEEKCDLVICISHIGWQEDPTRRVSDQYLAAHSRYIDLVLGGHTHTYFEHPRMVKNLDGREIPCSIMGKNARYIGHLTFTFEKK